uniref:EEF1A lysine methyltransferase 3 n=1 Tax=Caenorhabditis tropicalis TaxID=1561998 RepID=A0A1I7U693_9PELO
MRWVLLLLLPAIASAATTYQHRQTYYPSLRSQAKIRCLDWLNFDLNEWNEQPPDLIIAADVVYDTALLGSLCRVLRLLLSLSHSQAAAAIVACTRRNESSLDAFELHLSQF